MRVLEFIASNIYVKNELCVLKTMIITHTFTEIWADRSGKTNFLFLFLENLRHITFKDRSKQNLYEKSPLYAYKYCR